MTEDKHALLERYRRMREDLFATLEGLSKDAMTDASLDGWSVKDHLLHLAFWDGIRADEVERISAGYESVWRIPAGEDEVLNAMSYEARRGLSLAQARWELEVSRERLLAAISAASERGLDPGLYGEAGLTTTHDEQHSGWIRRWRSERGL